MSSLAMNGIIKFGLFFAFGVICHSSPIASRENDPCNVNASPSFVPVDDSTFASIVHTIIEDSSSGVKVHCRSIHRQAAYLSDLIMSNFPHISYYLPHDNMVDPIFCNISQHMNRQEVTNCLLSGYNILKTFSVSITALESANFPSRRHMESYLSVMSDIQDRVDRTLCSMAVNGFSQIVNRNSVAIHTAPFDIVSYISTTSTQTQIALKLYQLSKALEDTCSPIAMPRVLEILLQ